MEAITVKSAEELADIVITECADRLIEYRGQQTIATLQMRQEARSEARYLLNFALGIIPRIQVSPQKVFKEQPSLWNTMQDERDRRVIGKLLEETTELGTAASRCLIQGIDECEPSTGECNREWLENELADVRAMTALTIDHFVLDEQRINERAAIKRKHKQQWVDMPTPTELTVKP